MDENLEMFVQFLMADEQTLESYVNNPDIDWETFKLLAIAKAALIHGNERLARYALMMAFS